MIIKVEIFDTNEVKSIGSITIPSDDFNSIRRGDHICYNFVRYKVKRRTFDFDNNKTYLDVEKFIGNVGGY